MTAAADILFDPELDRLILRFEGLLRVSRILERQGATEAELLEHRRELGTGQPRAGELRRARRRLRRARRRRRATLSP